MNMDDDEYVELTGMTPLGDPGSWRVRPVAEVANTTSLLRIDVVETTGEDRLLRKRLPAEVRGAEDLVIAERQLDNEIRALVRLWARYAHEYPAELPHLVGYDFDAVEPFVLMASIQAEEPDGGEQRRILMVSERRKFREGLFRALAAVHAVDLVHGAVQLGTLCWRADSFQLLGFEHSAGRHEQPRSRPITLANRALPTGPADPADDIRAAGVAYFERLEGRPPTEAELAAPAELEKRLDAELHGTLALQAAGRPSAAQVVRAMQAHAELPDPIDVDHALRRGWYAFDTRYPVATDEFPVLTVPPSPPEPPPVLPLNRKIPAFVAVAVGAAMLVGLAIWMVVTA
ncbi:hypothetical protein GCM10027598_67380 [Amycolatopsis oliviviridis]